MKAGSIIVSSPPCTVLSWQQAPCPTPPNAFLPLAAVHFRLSRFPTGAHNCRRRDQNNPVMVFFCGCHFIGYRAHLSVWPWILILLKQTKAWVKPPDYEHPLPIIGVILDTKRFLNRSVSRSRWKDFNLLYILSFLWMVDELSKQRDIKPNSCTFHVSAGPD